MHKLHHVAMPQASPELFTLGYQLRSADDYIDVLLEAGVDVVVDVRETPWSHKKGFSAKSLAAALREEGIDYLHLPEAGNPKPIRREAEDHAECLRRYEAYLTRSREVLSHVRSILADLVGKGRRICLLCYERHPDDCHRSILLRHCFPTSAVRVSHLGQTGAPRLVK